MEGKVRQVVVKLSVQFGVAADVVVSSNAEAKTNAFAVAARAEAAAAAGLGRLDGSDHEHGRENQ
jgi:hypothetical protein